MGNAQQFLKAISYYLKKIKLITVLHIRVFRPTVNVTRVPVRMSNALDMTRLSRLSLQRSVLDVCRRGGLIDACFCVSTS